MPIPRLAFIYASLALIGIAAGCSEKTEPAAPPPAAMPPASQAAAPAPPPLKPSPALGSGVWVAHSIRGLPITPPTEARRPTIRFDIASNAASGYAGCNTFQGPFRASESGLRLGPFVTTRKACTDADKLEQDFLRAMAGTLHYRVSRESLEFLNANGTVIISFKAL